MIRDNIALLGNYKLLKKFCKICKRTDHFINSCPIVYFQIDKNLLIAKQNFSQIQPRETGFKESCYEFMSN